MTNILCACSHPDILRIMERLVNDQDGWSAVTASDLSTASDALNRQSFDVILLGAGFGPEEQARLQQLIDDNGSTARIVNHFGGGSGLLYAEVMGALGESVPDK